MVTPNSTPRYATEQEALFYVGMRVKCPGCKRQLRYGITEQEPDGTHLMLSTCPCGAEIPLPPYTPIA